MIYFYYMNYEIDNYSMWCLLSASRCSIAELNRALNILYQMSLVSVNGASYLQKKGKFSEEFVSSTFLHLLFKCVDYWKIVH